MNWNRGWNIKDLFEFLTSNLQQVRSVIKYVKTRRYLLFIVCLFICHPDELVSFEFLVFFVDGVMLVCGLIGKYDAI